MYLSDMTTTNFEFLKPSATLLDSIKLLRKYKLDGLPVISEKEKLEGIFTKANLYDALMEGTQLDDTIEKHYSPHVLSLNKNLSYGEVVAIVKRSPMGMAVVIDGDGRVVGLFTKVDMVMGALQRESELNARLRAAYDSIQTGLIVINKKGSVQLVNSYAEKLVGCKSEEIYRMDIEDALPKLSALLGLKQLLANESTGAQEHQKVKLGETDLLVSVSAINTDKGIIGCVISIQNISEVEKYASELRSVKVMNETLNMILEIGYDGIVVVDAAGKVTMMNNSFAKFLGIDKESVIGKPVEDVLENTRLQFVAKTGIPELNQIQMVNGRPYIVSRLPIVEEGTVVGAVGKMTFGQTEDLKVLADRIRDMENNLTELKTQLSKKSRHGIVKSVHGIISNSPEVNNIKEQICQVARGESTVLIFGESGTGKELVARALHMESPRREKPFIKVNCAAIPENLLEAEFFGYVRGAFTDASKQGKIGYFQMADGGSIFLDEIGDMPLSLQSKLLQVTEEMCFKQVGGDKTINVDVRIIAATNQQLDRKVREGSFREDLFYRLDVVSFSMPPLRKRPEDIVPLVHHFIEKYSDRFPGVEGISSRAMFCLSRYSWPGNVRELENIIERALNFAQRGKIECEHLPEHVTSITGAEEEPGHAKAPVILPHRSAENRQADNDYYVLKEKSELEVLKAALNATGGNKTEAARMLGISRSWLYKRIDQLGLKK